MDNYFATTDLALAAALRTLLSVNPTIHITDRLAEFRFRVDPQEAQRVADRYYGDHLSVNPRRYSQDLRDLKALIFAARIQNDNGG